MTTLAEAFRQAVTLHQQGRLAEAESIYRRVLAKDKLHDEALHLLGVLCHQTGRDAEALPLIQGAIARRKRIPEYHSHLGLVLAGLGRHADAEQAHRRAVSLAPDNGTMLNNLGVLLLNTGRVAEAEPLFEKAATLRANYADAFNNIGLARQRTGRPAAAKQAYEKAVALAPDHPIYLNNLGTVLQDLGELDPARKALARALELRPMYPEALNNLGLVLQRQGHTDEALGCFEQALKQRPGYADALHNQAHTLHAVGRIAEAKERYEAALAVEPGHVRAALDLATLLQRSGDLDGAARRHWQVLQRHPQNREARHQLVALFPLVQDRSFVDNEALGAIVADLLIKEDLAGALLWPAASALLRKRPAWADLPGQVALTHLEALAQEPLLLALLPRALAPDPGFEGRLVSVRQALLAEVGRPEATRLLPLACAVAGQVFLAEYVHDETPDEAAAVTRLEDTLLAAAEPYGAAVFAAYRPLAGRAWAETLADTGPGGPLGELLRVQVLEPRAERALAEEMPALTTIDDEVSQRVRAQYEENPYPRWRLVGMAGGRAWNDAFRHRYPWLADVALTPVQRALVAGCGTGQQPIRLTMAHPDLEVVGVDLSRRSLAYAARKARELGVAGRLKLGQGDLLKLPEAGELGLFDRVYATGVLHHMRDPAEGLRAVLTRLAPGGIVHLGLYSRIARRKLNAVRTWAANEGLAGDLAGIRAVRRKVMAELTNPDFVECMLYRDFYAASECRDLLLHVQEHQLDLKGVQALLDGAGLTFLAFEFDDPRIEPQFRRDAEARLGAGGVRSALRSLEAWADYEERHPETFRQMYQLYALKPA